MNRRHFLMSAATAAATTATKGLASPNDTVRLAVVGFRGQGSAHIKQYLEMPNVQIVALCDIDDSVMTKGLASIDKAGKPKPETYKDIRKLLEKKDLDAVSIATPNHSHTLQTIWAMDAGKHVYIEKPCSHNMFEAKQIVAAAHKYNKLVQHGTNCRSGVAIREAVQQMREGLIGDVYMARGLCYKRRDTIGRTPVQPVPEGVDYDLWLGPAPKHEFTKNRFHYTWHWFWDYGNGDLGNQGIHEVDVARWGLGVTYPTKISATGGHFLYDDDQETPNVITCNYEFNDGGKKRMMTFEVRGMVTGHEGGIGETGLFGKGNTVGNLFYGSKGWLAIDGYTHYQSYLGPNSEPGPGRTEPGNNWANFIAALRSGKKEELNAPIEEGAISTTLVHLANISYRLGRTIEFDKDTYSIKNDPQANAMFTRPYRAPFVVPKLA